jgi:galactokinase
MQAPDPRERLIGTFGGGAIEVAWAPGRVNLIGEHIDYHGLAVLPMALERGIRVAFRAGAGRRIRAVSEGYGVVEFDASDPVPAPRGDWSNYLRAAALAAGRKWEIARGVDAGVVSDLPSAAGLASSSALLVAFTLALLRANRHEPAFEDLMEVLPEGEQFVGTRGGGMDHAACLGSRSGCASLIGFAPLSLRPIRLPAGWKFLVAHSLQTAEKSGAAREEYNARRRAGAMALEKLGLASYREAMESDVAPAALADGLADGPERDAFLHVTSEAERVRRAVDAMERRDAAGFGRILGESHASLRDRLRVSSPALDRLVAIAMDSGALGARPTGAGMGGCAVIFSTARALPLVRRGLIASFYRGRPEFEERRYLIEARPGAGALAEREA